ncbi:MAG: hypothetical protein MUC66_01580 [Methanolinea sp.]|nr:hypothetical protein [Methanolinea sp.]
MHSEQDVSTNSRHEIVGRFQGKVTETRWLPFIPGAKGEESSDDSEDEIIPGKNTRD